MDYQTYTPSEELAMLVNCYWTLEAAAGNTRERQRIVPDGCMEMIFHYGDLYRQWLNHDQSIIQPRCFVFGQITEVLEIEPTGATGIISVRFQPDGLFPFVSFPLSDLNQKATPLEDLFGEPGGQLGRDVLSATTTADRIQVIESFLKEQLSSSEVQDRMARQCVELLLQSRGQTSIDEMSKQAQLSRRQLERRFARVIGLSPKQLTRIIRFQQALKMIAQREAGQLTELAYENGYYDQSHFIRDFQEFTGFSPGKFFSPGLEISQLFWGRSGT